MIEFIYMCCSRCFFFGQDSGIDKAKSEMREEKKNLSIQVGCSLTGRLSQEGKKIHIFNNYPMVTVDCASSL